jgi:sulfate adenylyltransferase subunit 2
LDRLEAESIAIMREAVAEAKRPVMLYSMGKDSSVMLHLATKAFYPAPLPFPLLHVDTTWTFQEMYEFRDAAAARLGAELIVHHGAAVHTEMWKTQGLRQALDRQGFDIAVEGARRDEQGSQANERIFSIRSAEHQWDAKEQRPELWHLYNVRKSPGHSIRVFPLSNWTELDVWHYIRQQQIPVVSLYLAAARPVVERNGMLLMVDDDRMPLEPGEKSAMRKVRFRALGRYPLTGAVESNAATVTEVIQEILLTGTSERHTRAIDHDQSEPN